MSSMNSSDIIDSAPTESRRDFLKALVLAVGGSSMIGCARTPDDPIVPAVSDQTGDDVPIYYATALTRHGYATGVLVKTRFGHPIKVEGNLAHPASLGGTDVFAQASIFSLWSEQRSKNVKRRGALSNWDAFGRELSARLNNSRDGSDVHLLAEATTSPTLLRLRHDMLQRYRAARWHTYGALPRDNVYAGATLAFGRALEPRYDFTRADVVVALDVDFLTSLPGSIRYARDFATRRNRDDRSRLYSIETSPSSVSILADHRLALAPRDIESFASALLARLHGTSSSGPYTKWIDAIADDFSGARRHSVVVCGDQAPPELHAIVHAINAQIDAIGNTVSFSEPSLDETQQIESLRALTDALRAGSVETLLILGGNPIYTAPADLEISTAIDRATWSAHLAIEDDETSLRCDWHLPMSHELETWGDARAFDGTVSLQQPTIAPLHDSKSCIELLSMAVGKSASGFASVRETWKALKDDAWSRALRDGIVIDSASATTTPTLHQQEFSTNTPATTDHIAIVFRADPTIDDGAHAANAWLQELPKPFTQLTWSNAALIAPSTAKRLDLADEDIVSIDVDGTTINAPIVVVDGHAEDCVTLSLGYGRTRAGESASGIGFNAGVLRRSNSLWFTTATIRKTGMVRPLARTQRRAIVGADNPVRVLIQGDTPRRDIAPPSLFPPAARTNDYAWGMAINLDACIGCNVCTIACQSENNIPSVGSDQVRRGRAMHWIRIDHYVEDAEHPRLHSQPVPCMHCESAPCEVVCPVGATVHDHEGLNVQVYNRCIGTRFCGNNCPYKVRRFNFLQFTTEALRDFNNPDVTVRNRGVMEKCTYCIQRIETARIETDRDGKKIRDGNVLTACQAACPTEAIVFGDINDPDSAVSRAKADPRNYALLGELNTRPRTTYLAKRRNPRPDLDT